MRRIGLLIALAGAGALALWVARTVPPARSESTSAATPGARAEGVTALGRLQPRKGVIRVAGPSRPSVVIGRLEVEEGDAVAEGQVIAVLDSWTLEKTEIARLEAELENARAEVRRREELGRDGVVSPSERDAWRTKVAVVDAQLARARAEADMAVVRSPLKGRVLDIFARAGERVGPDGIAEIAETEQMYAVAEVYETDIARVRVGQRATVTSPALPQALDGAVEVIHLKVGKKDVLDTDPAARTDARVVEVEIRLEDSRAAAGLTNLQVQVAIAP